MKKIILSSMMMISTMMFSQITDVTNLVTKCETVGKIGPMGVFMGEIKKCDNNTYDVSYRDYKFTKITEIKHFSFEDKDGAYDFLYNSIIKGLTDLPKENIILKLPDDLLSLKFEKTLGTPCVTIYHTNKAGVTGVSQTFTRKQIEKLFGKK